MSCFSCQREDTQRCTRCGNDYCPDHGSKLCASCLDPLNATPSRSAFRLALGGLLIGTVLALWLIVRPPSVPGESSDLIQSEPTATPALTPQGSGSPSSATPTPAPTEVPTAAPTPVPTEAPPPPTEVPVDPGPLEYTVQEGDTWSSIALAYGYDPADLASVNGLDLEYVLQPGDVLSIPQ